jgi:hypothetical protein
VSSFKRADSQRKETVCIFGKIQIKFLSNLKAKQGPQTRRKRLRDAMFEKVFSLEGCMEASPGAWNFSLQYFQFLAENTWV